MFYMWLYNLVKKRKPVHPVWGMLSQLENISKLTSNIHKEYIIRFQENYAKILHNFNFSRKGQAEIKEHSGIPKFAIL